jgi:hypothetical protein
MEKAENKSGSLNILQTPVSKGFWQGFFFVMLFAAEK